MSGWASADDEAVFIYAAIDEGAASSVVATRLTPELKEVCASRELPVQFHAYVPTGDSSFTTDLRIALSEDAPRVSVLSLLRIFWANTPDCTLRTKQRNALREC